MAKEYDSLEIADPHTKQFISSGVDRLVLLNVLHIHLSLLHLLRLLDSRGKDLTGLGISCIQSEPRVPRCDSTRKSIKSKIIWVKQILTRIQHQGPYLGNFHFYPSTEQVPHHLPIPLTTQSSHYWRGGMNWGLLSIWRGYLPPSCLIDPEFSIIPCLS